ncbi:trigger factor [Sinomicrobium weinanense]|uniref:Trigger factor n=1 Tax=Sinomicrobium weinanense TaxID=2842200 RepID=A0A926JPQ6_9FLAO|nr:trigger factor [Sinomicrobium weinanense]MBC9795027.1 trigger factor [Sinomicrobium weinanense]MBU3125112.1 trigger factor [Sinomicrobium weinanense]
MDITREHIDELNAIVKVAINKDDYSDKVATVLNDYRKKANIPGFRKGHVPLGLVKKQYGKAVLVDEVNKLLQDALDKYLTEEKLDVLGNPLPKAQEDFNWDAEDFSFEFELGLAPEFEVTLKGKKAITQYHIVADDKMLNEQVERIQKQYGKLVSKDTVEEGDEITGTFTSEEKEIENKATFSLDKIKGKRNLNKFTDAKVGDVLELKTKSLFQDDHDLITFLKVSHDEAHDLDIAVSFKVEEINKREPAELNQELFDKLFPDGSVTSEEELRTKIKEDSEKQFEQQADQKLLNDITEYLVDSTKFDLPGEFLQKWIQQTGENPLTEDEAREEYEKSEKGLRYQLIEGKIIQENELQVNFDELKDFAKDFIKIQMAQFGQTNPSEEELDSIAARILSNQDEVKRLSEQLMSQKLLNLYKEKANLKTKEVTYEDFVKEVYQ